MADDDLTSMLAEVASGGPSLLDDDSMNHPHAMDTTENHAPTLSTVASKPRSTGDDISWEALLSLIREHESQLRKVQSQMRHAPTSSLTSTSSTSTVAELTKPNKYHYHRVIFKIRKESVGDQNASQGGGRRVTHQ